MMVSSMPLSPFTAGSRLARTSRINGWLQDQWVQGFPELAMILQHLGGKRLVELRRLSIELCPRPSGQGRVLPGQDIKYPGVIFPHAGRQAAHSQGGLFRVSGRGHLEQTTGQHNQTEAKKIPANAHCSLRSRSAIQPATSLSSSAVNARYRW